MKKNPDLIKLAKIYKNNPMFLSEIKENYPELFSIYQSHYTNKRNFKGFLKDFNLEKNYSDLFYEKHIMPKIKTKEMFLNDIKTLATEISNKNDGLIPIKLYTNNDTRKLAITTNKYFTIKGIERKSSDEIVLFLKGLGYNFEEKKERDTYNKDYYRKKIIKHYNEVDIALIKDFRTREARRIKYLCKRYNPNQSWKETLKELSL